MPNASCHVGGSNLHSVLRYDSRIASEEEHAMALANWLMRIALANMRGCRTRTES